MRPGPWSRQFRVPAFTGSGPQPRRRVGQPTPMSASAGSGTQATTSSFYRLSTSEHIREIGSIIVARPEREPPMISRQRDAAGGRPFNNLLRRLNDADFALVEPHLVAADGDPNDLLYSPGDNV